MFTQQIKFIDNTEEKTYIRGGILIDNEFIICGECGGVFEANDPEVEIIEKYENWVSISDEIIGD